MKSCNLVSAVIYLENLHSQLLTEGNATASNLLDSVVTEIKEARSDIVNNSALAGAVPVNIYDKFAEAFKPVNVGTNPKNSPPKQKAEPTYETVAGFTLGEVKSVEMSELLDLVGEISAYADSNRPDVVTNSSTKNYTDTITRLLKAYVGDSGNRVKVRLVSNVTATEIDNTTGKKVSREALGKYNNGTGILTLALNPNRENLSKASLAITTSKVILHELVHAMTVSVLKDDVVLNNRIENLRKHAVEMYKKANGKEPSYAPGSDTYGLKNSKEFVAEVVTGYKLQKLLAGMSPTRAKTIIERVKALFKEIIAKIKSNMGIDPDSYTLLDEAIEATDSAIKRGIDPLLGREQEVVDAILDGNNLDEQKATLSASSGQEVTNTVNEPSRLSDSEISKMVQESLDTSKELLARTDIVMAEAKVARDEAAKLIAAPLADNSNSISDEGYRFTKDGEELTTNEGQTIAIDAMKEWYKADDKTKPHFLLQGRGGTGKTTVINVLMDELNVKTKDIMFATPTHKALKVIKESNRGNKYRASKYKTLASLLEVKPKQDKRGNIVTFEKEWDADDVVMPKVLVVDEASMVHSMNYDMLIEEAAMAGTRIVFMGDHAQLAPVKDARARVKSVVFGELDNSTVHLNQLMRQAEGSPIILFTDALINIVNAVETMTEEGEFSAVEANQRLRATTFDSSMFTRIDEETGEGVALTTEAFDEIFPQFMRDYEADPVNTKYIHFNNHVHDDTVAITARIREKLFGDRALSEPYIKGEPLILNAPTSQMSKPPGDISRMETLDNGEEFTVIDYEIDNNTHVDYFIGRTKRTTVGAIPMYKIRAEDTINGATVTFLKPVNNADVERLIDEESKVMPKGKEFHAGRVRAFLATGLGLGYVINGHKSQGSTYNTVYMDIGNIIGQYDDYVSANDKIKSAYVGGSRPRKRLVVIDNRTNNSTIINSKKLPITNSVFANVNTVEATKMAEDITDCKGTGV